MKTAKKVLKWTGFCLGGLAVALTAAVLVLERRTFEAPYPAIQASGEPEVIARGRYLAYGAAHCVDCHGDPGRRDDLTTGREVPFSGGVEFVLPVGTFRSANITSDRQHGIGAMSDEAIARSLRYGVGRHGQALLPFMPFAELADDDLRAVISYLRTLPPVAKPVVTREPNVLGHVVTAFVLRPTGPPVPPPAQVTPGPTVEYGRYLAHSVANCRGCHTNRDLKTGAFIGPDFAGGLELHERTGVFVTPNLTPDAKTGRIASWDEEVFVARFRTGKGATGSPMPWGSFGRMSDDDLRAIFRYLRTVPAVENDTGDAVRGERVASR